MDYNTVMEGEIKPLKGEKEMEEKDNKDFIGYEYREMKVSGNDEQIITDGYNNFGWEKTGETSNGLYPSQVTLKFRRDRNIRNKAELGRLQRQFDNTVKTIGDMEKSKSSLASIIAYVIGIVGTAFMAGSVFSYLGNVIWSCVVLAIPGFIGWIIPYFVYSKIKKVKTAKINPMIEDKYEQLYQICKKANGLTAK